MMEQHFVTFYSPGTFVAEMSERPIVSWDVNAAVAMARSIKERYGATPYGFRFSTRSRADDELDSSVTATSAMYYLGGKIETLDEIENRGDPNEHILRTNMRANGFDRVIVSTNSWRWTQPLREGDIVLPYDPQASAPPANEPQR